MSKINFLTGKIEFTVEDVQVVPMPSVLTSPYSHLLRGCAVLSEDRSIKKCFAIPFDGTIPEGVLIDHCKGKIELAFRQDKDIEI